MTRALMASLVLAALTLPAVASAQPLERGPVLVSLVQPPGGAAQVRTELRQLLQQHPPSVATVLRADPSLLGRPDYLASYPRLQEFLKEHPEVARDPVYFFGAPNSWPNDSELTPQERASNRAMGMLEGVLAGIAVLTGVLAAFAVLASLVRQAIGHRRWLRQSRIQTEVHTKILDRLQSNEELLAYVQSPAGQRFLESGPSPQVSEARTIGAPYGRILWSVQAGVMLLALGVGFWVIRGNVMAEIVPAISAMGTIAMALGMGALCSAALAYFLSARLGLLAAAKE